jgi:hypothetical protein
VIEPVSDALGLLAVGLLAEPVGELPAPAVLLVEEQAVIPARPTARTVMAIRRKVSPRVGSGEK